MLFNVSLEDISFKGHLLIMPPYKLPSEHVLNENLCEISLIKKKTKLTWKSLTVIAREPVNAGTSMGSVRVAFVTTSAMLAGVRITS